MSSLDERIAELEFELKTSAQHWKNDFRELDFANEAMSLLRELKAERDAATANNERLLKTLAGIANADWHQWKEEGLASPDEFVMWAKSRAVHALQGGE